MRRLMLLWGICLTIAIAFASPDDRTVVIVSWDGGKPSVIRALAQRGELPTIRSLMADGSYTFIAETIVPSSTLPSHASMLTGLSYRRHGVDWNSYQPEKGTVTVTTIFELAKKAGLRTAMVFSKEKFKHFAKLNTVDVVEYVRGDADKVAEVAARVLTTQKPNLLFVHFSDPDSAGHKFGWGNDAKGVPPSDEFLAALRRCDGATGALVAALKRNGQWEKTLLIVTADHGGHDRMHRTANPEDVRIPWIAAGGLAAKAGELNEPVRTMDTAATALAALGLSVPNDWDGKPVWAALRDRGQASMNGKPLPILAEWRGIHCGITDAQTCAITDAKEWAQLWRRMHQDREPMPDLPSVDFSRQMVLAAFMGRKPTGGYTIQITRVVAENGTITVTVRETAPSPNTPVIQALTHPFHIVVVPKVNGTVRFVREQDR
jgi:hypothetical protein